MTIQIEFNAPRYFEKNDGLYWGSESQSYIVI